MKLIRKIDSSTLIAVTTLLSSSFSEITPETLLDALTSYEEKKKMEKEKDDSSHPPLTRKEVSDILKVSLPTVNKMLNDGRLKRIKLNSVRNGTVRIEYSSVMKLISNQ